MTWVSLLSNVVYYVALPIIFVFNILLAILAPVKHLAAYTFHALLLPLRILGRFETLYIYFGVAAVIGIATGCLLHFSSSLLITLLDLRSKPEETGRTAASVRAAREKRKLEQAWQTATPIRVDPSSAWIKDGSPKEFADYMDTDRGNRSLLSQTILEEEDDSEDAF